MAESKAASCVADAAPQALSCFLKKFFRDTPKNTPLNLLASEGTFPDKGKAASLNFEN